MLTNDIPFTDMPAGETVDFTQLANQYNALLQRCRLYEETLKWVSGLAEYEGSEAIRLSEAALTKATARV